MARSVLENVALHFPRTGTYARTDNDVKSISGRGPPMLSHGNPRIGSPLRMVALSRLMHRRVGLQIDLEVV